MEQLVVCIIVWLVVVLLIPFRRIWALRRVLLISVAWMIFVDNMAAFLGYYSFEHILVPVGRASLFQLLAYAGIGVLMINWLREDPLSKLLSVVTVAAAFSIVQFVYIQWGAFRFGRFDMITSLIENIAALSLFLQLALTVAGERTVYSGIKTRDFLSSRR